MCGDMVVLEKNSLTRLPASILIMIHIDVSDYQFISFCSANFLLVSMEML